MATTASFTFPLRRTEHFFDDERILSYSKDKDDDMQLTWNFKEWLASGETISSVTYDEHGVTVSGSSVSSPSITFTVNGVGSLEVSLESSASRTKVIPVRFYAPGDIRTSDYRG